MVSVYPSWAVDLTAKKLPGMAWYIFDVEFRRQASYNLSIKLGEHDIQLTFMSLPKSGCCSCVSTDHLSDACPLSPHKSWDGPTLLLIDKLTCIQEALCWWATGNLLP